MASIRRKLKLETDRLCSENAKPDNLYKKSLATFNKIFGIAGCNIFSEDYLKLNFTLLFGTLDIITYIPINIYTMVILWGSLVDVAFCLVTLGCGFQGVAKMYTYLAHRATFLELNSYNEKFFDHKRWPQKIREIQIKCNVLLKFLSNLFFIVYGSVLLLIFINPFVVSLITGERELMFGFQLPFVDPKSDFGYPLNMVHHTIQLILTVIGFLGADGLYLTFMISGFGHLDVLGALLVDLN